MRYAGALTTLLVALTAAAAVAAGATQGSSCAAASTALHGLEGDDLINGSPGPDCIDGGPGNDRIAGLDGADTLVGQAGDDLLAGGAGADVLTGGLGADKLSGGPGADRLVDAPRRYEDMSMAPAMNRLAAGSGGDRVDTANGRRDVVHCGGGRDRAVADRGDRLEGCERRRFRRSPLPEARPRTGGRKGLFLVRFRALEEVASQSEHFSITVDGPAACGRIQTSSLGVRYRAGETVRYRLKPFGPGGAAAKRWCRGLYRGTVDFTRDAGLAFRFGHFTFRVR